MSHLTDRQAYLALIDHLMGARDAARSLGLMRSDTRWIQIASMFDQIKDKSTLLMQKRQQPVPTRIWTPNSVQ